MSISLVIDILGVIAFSMSGVLSAVHKRLDIFGIFVIAFVTSVGGGTIRDVLLDVPIVWMQNMLYVSVIFGAAVIAVIFRRKLNYVKRSLFLFDTIGISLYTILGIQKGVDAGLHPAICVALGTISACFGGVLRDILCNEIPVIFRKEIYATACILGGVFYFLLQYMPLKPDWIVIISGLIVFSVRLFAVVFKWSLPSLYSKDEINPK